MRKLTLSLGLIALVFVSVSGQQGLFPEIVDNGVDAQLDALFDNQVVLSKALMAQQARITALEEYNLDNLLWEDEMESGVEWLIHTVEVLTTEIGTLYELIEQLTESNPVAVPGNPQ